MAQKEYSSTFRMIRIEHRSEFTRISNAVLRDSRLSLAAKGFLAEVMSLPDDWDFSVRGMAVLIGVNKDTVLRYIRELERLGYLSIETGSENGRFCRKVYTFYEQPITENTVTENTVTENTVTENTVTENTVTENTPQLTNDKSTNEDKQTIDPINCDDRQQELSVIEAQIKADRLRNEFGTVYIDRVVEVIADCMKADSRTINGERVDKSELVRVFGEVRETDVRKAILSVRGKQFGSFSGYFGSVLFNVIKKRLDNAGRTALSTQPDSGYPSTLELDEYMESVLRKYRESAL